MPERKVAIITGCSQGIGRATAILMRDKGWHVLNLSRRNPDLKGVGHCSADLALSDWPDSLREALQQHIEGAAKVAIVHNAALLESDSVQSVSAERFRQVLELNVIAPSRLNQMVLPQMKPGSSIIYIGSTLGEKAVANSCSYVSSKHALIGLMRATCQDLAGTGVHTCCICPGFTDTAMLREHVGGDTGILDSLSSGVTFGRLIEPAEIAATVDFCSANPVINGAVLHANLGQVEH